MHIPDGYLSPSTCAVTYVLALPACAVALRRLRRRLHTRTVPLLALVAAFCFVVMMFNLPLPGGTSGHAVGMGIAAIVLGPAAAIVAISMALLVQALFFGDGGLTTFGANCLNMAVVGSLVAYAVYRLVAGQAPLAARRRVVAAAAAGYVGINVAALLAAIELGIQPLLFHDASGAPLYAPYPLSVALPAMLIGHLTFAGLAEAVIGASLVAYLQRAHPELLAATAAAGVARGTAVTAGGWQALRGLWWGLAGLMIATPLGLLAAGEAWSEWGPEEFSDPQARAIIAHASGNVPLPAAPPAGLAHLAGLWAAPFADYAPRFVTNPGLGYLLSAILGSGLILLAFLLFGRFARRHPASATPDGR
jgi:cobalt/nickel transport system permease protein